MKKYLLITLSFLLFLPNLFHKDVTQILPYNNIEKFDPKLAYINTIKKLEQHIDSIAIARSITISDNLNYVEVADSIVKEKFYHGFSHFALNENWIAAYAAKYIWVDLSCKVLPEDIIKYNYAGCSQQELVMMAILRDKKISYRSVLFPHHYALEVMINNKWYYFDPNMEPTIMGEERQSEYWHNSADSLKRYYTNFDPKKMDFVFGNGQPLLYGAVNEIPAAHARLFHSVTGVVSKIVWLFPLLLLFIPVKKRAKK